MRRKSIVTTILLMLMLLLPGYSTMANNTPDTSESSVTDEIRGTTSVEEVDLMVEYVAIESKETNAVKIAKGIATFARNGKIYLLGHGIDQQGGFVFKADKSTDIIDKSGLIGKVIANRKNGVIAEQTEYFLEEEYPTISVGKKIKLGEASILGRDDDGNICKYPIKIDAFSEEQNMFIYSSSEIKFEKGFSGSPIIQDDKLIGVHYGSTDDQKIGAGIIIWTILSQNEW